MNLLSRYSWLLGIVLVALYSRAWHARARLLIAAGRLSAADAARFRRLALFGAGCLIGAVALAQLTFRGAHAVCALYADPLRPPALVAWMLILGVLLRVGTLGLTRDGAAFLVRVCPALALSKPIDQEWTASQVVVRTVLPAALFGFLFALLLWDA